MQCTECQKRPATLHLTQIINGKKTEINVCKLCAKKKGYVNNEESYSLHDLLSSIFNIGPSQIELKDQNFFEQLEDLECPKCNMSFQEFQRIGKFGCASCYKTFQEKLDAIFRRVHSGNTKHNGKIPKRKGTHLHLKKEMEEYQLELKKLIEQEEFEQAAVIRDKIKDIQKKETRDNA